MECIPIKLYFVYWPSWKRFNPQYYLDYKLIKKDKEYIHYYRAGYTFKEYVEQRGKLRFHWETNKIATEDMQLRRARLYMEQEYGNDKDITRKFLTQYLSNLEKGAWLGRQFKWLNDKINNKEFPNDSQTDNDFVKDMMDRMGKLQMYGIDVYPSVRGGMNVKM